MLQILKLSRDAPTSSTLSATSTLPTCPSAPPLTTPISSRPPARAMLKTPPPLFSSPLVLPWPLSSRSATALFSSPRSHPTPTHRRACTSPASLPPSRASSYRCARRPPRWPPRPGPHPRACIPLPLLAPPRAGCQALREALRLVPARQASQHGPVCPSPAFAAPLSALGACQRGFHGWPSTSWPSSCGHCHDGGGPLD